MTCLIQQNPNGDPAPLTILVVDDERPICRAIKRVLTGAGHNAVLAHDGHSALKLIGERHFDYALIDYWMPPPNGLHVLRELGRMQPQCIPIAMTGSFEITAMVDAINQHDVCGFVQKPFTERELLDVIDDTAQQLAARAGFVAPLPCLTAQSWSPKKKTRRVRARRV